MRIFFASGEAAMLLDARPCLNALHKRAVEFVASGESQLSLPAAQDRSPAPYQEFLAGLRFRKGSGPLVLRLTPDRWLELEGASEYLSQYIEHFHFEESDESGHHHPDHGYHMARGTLKLIIEADTSWEEQFES